MNVTERELRDEYARLLDEESDELSPRRRRCTGILYAMPEELVRPSSAEVTNARSHPEAATTPRRGPWERFQRSTELGPNGCLLWTKDFDRGRPIFWTGHAWLPARRWVARLTLQPDSWTGATPPLMPTNAKVFGTCGNSRCVALAHVGIRGL